MNDSQATFEPTTLHAHLESVAHHRPSNLPRLVFHLGSGALALTLLRVLPGRGWLIAFAAAFAASAWTMETLRRRSEAVNERLMRFFGPVAHAHERDHVNSATWYATALLFLGLFTPLHAAELGVLVLAVADPFAALIGRRFGRVRFRSGRSLEGTLAFVVAAAVASSVWLALASHGRAHNGFAIVLVASVAGALAEAFLTVFDDNFAIPVVTALAAAWAERLLPHA